jgi:hypothetical protein
MLLIRRLTHHALLPAVLVVLFALIITPSSSVSAAEFNPGCNVAQLVADIATAGSNGQEDTINLAAGCTYTLTSTLTINADSGNLLTINGNGATLSGNDTVRVLSVNTGANVVINNVTVTAGGGIANYGALSLTNSAISSNSAPYGGGILNYGGNISLSYSTISDNIAIHSGGGIYNENGTVSITHSTLSQNQATLGGGIFNYEDSSLIVISGLPPV